MLTSVTIGFMLALIPFVALLLAVACIALFHYIRGY